jgi:phosphatidylglycerophosphate synthase
MSKYINKLPVFLIYSRIVIGGLIILLSLSNIPHHQLYVVILFAIGLLTDIFDGIIARRLNVSTPLLRRMDSSADQVFFISVAIATYLLCPAFFKANMWAIIILLVAESLTYLICFLKFKKEIATHSIGAKIWTLILFATLIQIIWQCESGVLFSLCIWLGVFTRLEIIGIVLILRNWTSDVPSAYHALLLRQGKEINRHKLFNG